MDLLIGLASVIIFSPSLDAAKTPSRTQSVDMTTVAGEDGWLSTLLRGKKTSPRRFDDNSSALFSEEFHESGRWVGRRQNRAVAVYNGHWQITSGKLCVSSNTLGKSICRDVYKTGRLSIKVQEFAEMGRAYFEFDLIQI